MNQRISREQLYIGFVDLLAKRSSCLRGQVGAILIKDRRVILQGYNGVLENAPECSEISCDIHNTCTRSIHAEANLISSAARFGIATEGCSIYISCAPCLTCAKLIVQSGIIKVFYLESYKDSLGIQLLRSVRLNDPKFKRTYIVIEQIKRDDTKQI